VPSSLYVSNGVPETPIPSVQELPKLLLGFLDTWRRAAAFGYGGEQSSTNCKHRGGPEKVTDVRRLKRRSDAVVDT
jgi:hypothetical protein